MPKFKKIVGNYVEVVDRLGLPDHFYKPGTEGVYKHDVLKDLARTSYVSFDRTADQLKNQLQVHSDESYSYTQGNFVGRIFTKIYVENCQMYTSSTDDAIMHDTHHDYLQSIEMAYIDDRGRNCGFTLTYLREPPVEGHPDIPLEQRKRHFSIAIIENTTAEPTARKVTFLCSSELFSENHQGADLDAAAVHGEVEQALNSRQINTLLLGLIKDGVLSMPTFEALRARIKGGLNIDNRDEQRIVLDRKIATAKAGLPKTPEVEACFAEIIEDSKRDINFYKVDYFNNQLQAIDDYVTYVTNISAFQTALELYNTDSSSDHDKHLYLRGQEVLSEIQDAKRLGEMTVPKVIEALFTCTGALNDPVNIGKLAGLSQACSGKSSSFLKKLGGSLLAFASALLVLAGILLVPWSGGSSLLLTYLGSIGVGAGVAAITGAAVVAATAGIGVGFFKHGSEKGLAKSVSNLKTALENTPVNDPVINKPAEGG